MDTLICQGFEYDCQLGFHDHEQGVTQRISVDIEVSVDASQILKCEKQGAKDIAFDYFKANQIIAEFLKNKKFNLIETVGEVIAEMLLNCFKIPSVKVSVTKKPLNMPNVGSVKYVCERCRGGF